ncbi:hypothetical protein VTO42DRAFT_1244 [Malbranchea cinnamomea]
MGVTTLSNRTDFNNALEVSKIKTASNNPKLVVIDCFATWCGPCKAIAPKIEEYSEKYPDVAFYKVDVDEVPDVAQELGVRAMPTFIFFKDGQKVDEVLGAVPPAIEAAVKKHSGAA